MHEYLKQKQKSHSQLTVSRTETSLKSLRAAAGLLKKKRRSLELYYAKTRKQWSE